MPRYGRVALGQHNCPWLGTTAQTLPDFTLLKLTEILWKTAWAV